MIGEKTIIPADIIPESDIAPIMRRANELKEENEKLKEKNEYLQKEVEDAKAVGERALCEVQELTEKNKRLVHQNSISCTRGSYSGRKSVLGGAW